MNAGLKLVTVCLASVMVAAGCGQSATKASNGELKVKGIYLGMDLTEAQSVFKQLLANASDYGTSEIGNGPHPVSKYGIGVSDGTFFGCQGFGGYGGATADKNGKVNGYFFKGRLVEKIFNVAEMSDSDFAKKFADSYGIPEFNVSEEMNAWYYDSPKGYRVQIMQGKIVIVKQITSEQEQKFD